MTVIKALPTLAWLADHPEVGPILRFVSAAWAAGLVLAGFALGLAAGHRWRTRLVDLIDYLGEEVAARRFANNMQASTVDELRGELDRISGEHPAIAERWSFAAEAKAPEGWT